MYTALQAAASPLGHSTVQGLILRADDETRTRDPNLGKVVRYQLRYIRTLSFENSEIMPQNLEGCKQVKGGRSPSRLSSCDAC